MPNSPSPLVLPFLLLAACAAQAGPASGASAPVRPPNIVVILADDLSYDDLGCFGQKQFTTPNIDRLAAEGMVFTNAYSGAPWCAPSRTALLTGYHVGHPAPRTADGRPAFRPTVAQLLKSAGYATCAVGKWHMQEPGGTQWFYGTTTLAQARAKEVPASMPWNRGFDVCRIGYAYGLNPHYPHQIETGDASDIPLPENKDVDDDYMSKNYRKAGMYNAKGRFLDKAGHDSTRLTYGEDIYRKEAVAFMRAHKDKPFFLYYATPLMHGPLAVKELGEFKDKPAPWTPAHKVWAAEARELDRSVGLLVDELKSLGVAKDTVLLFASDNGYAEWGYLGRGNWVDDPLFCNKGPWNRGKFVNANGGVIVPCIAWGGRVAQGRTGRAINLCDLMATASELAQAKLPGPTDGVSFAPLLAGRDKDQPLRREMVWPRQGNYGITIPDDSAPPEPGEAKPPQHLPPAVLLDERFFAQGFGKRQETIRIFDIVEDPSCKRDLSREQPDLRGRAAAAFQRENAAR